MNCFSDIGKKVKLNKRKIEPTERLDFLRALAADTRLTKTNAAAVAIYLISCRNGQTGLINPGYATIAKGAGCSVSAAKTAVNKLDDTGWFVVIGQKKSSGTNHSNTYIPNWDQARDGIADTPVVSQTDEVVSQTDEGGSAGRRRVVRLQAANSVNLNPVKEPSEPTPETTCTASGRTCASGGPADLKDRREDDYDEYEYEPGGKYYLPGSRWYEMDENPLGDLNLQNEYAEIFEKWPEYSHSENLSRYMELRRSGVPFDRIESSAGEVRDDKISLPDFLAGGWKDFDPNLDPWNPPNDNHPPFRKASGSDIDFDEDPPF